MFICKDIPGYALYIHCSNIQCCQFYVSLELFQNKMLKHTYSIKKSLFHCFTIILYAR